MFAPSREDEIFVFTVRPICLRLPSYHDYLVGLIYLLSLNVDMNVS